MSADVLVIGSSGKNWLRRHFGGSVSDYVTHHAPCPVMLIRHDHSVRGDQQTVFGRQGPSTIHIYSRRPGIGSAE